MSDIPQSAPLIAYHERTKHRFQAFAEGPGQLDWEAQPDAFRRYPGSPLLSLPLSAKRHERPFGEIGSAPQSSIGVDLDSLGALLELSFGISAWKRWGPNRWALRCNPSSGNLHPVEAYVLCGGLPDVPDGLHHYDPQDHLLEGRALHPGDRQPWLAIGLSSAMWREAWKYGERAFRYCQLDVGHAAGALAYAAGLLDWRIKPHALSGSGLAHLLGLDRPDDFPPSRYAYTEAEEPEILFAIHAPGLGSPPEPLEGWLDTADWHGTPSQIDPAPGYRWPLVGQAASASRCRQASPEAPLFPDYPPLAPHDTPQGAAQLIRQRRSGQRFDPAHRLSRQAFYRMLDATLPRPGIPFDAQESLSAIHLLLFVLRVDGLAPGLYLLPRRPHAAENPIETPGGLGELFAASRPVSQLDPECPPHLGLVRLRELGLQETQRLARALSCHQDIASTSAFSLGMLGNFSSITNDGYAYRCLLREAGLIGQVLYLEAEAAGVRGTGIGCFFDDPVHDAFGIADPRWQSVYHFTVGTPIVDARIENLPPYPQRPQESP